ncbi:MAG: cobamide remodeling phosphodiesterase CbiR [Desulfonauticus sp.]|nr:cobamide remodeling phosphodiesterase CbiR [Desulfonauticus sp.]
MKVCRLAAPSYVLGGDILQNCLFLKDYVSGVYLAFFQTMACLNYSKQDLPLCLKDLGLRYHIHFPLDLSWENPEQEAKICVELWNKAALLSPWCGVLHPPATLEALEIFIQTWVKLGRKADEILLENIKDRNLRVFWPLVQKTGLNVCLDIGHLLAYDQEDILFLPGFWNRVKMLHVYGLEKDNKHYGLEFLGDRGWKILKNALSKTESVEVVLELFDRKSFLSSYEFLKNRSLDWGVSFV